MPLACRRPTTFWYPAMIESVVVPAPMSLIPSSQITWVSPDRPSTPRSSRSTAAGPAAELATTGLPAMALVDDADLVAIGIKQSAGKRVHPPIIYIERRVCAIGNRVTKGANDYRVGRGHDVHRAEEARKWW